MPCKNFKVKCLVISKIQSLGFSVLLIKLEPCYCLHRYMHFTGISFNQMLLPSVGDITINEHNESVYLVYQ